MLSFSDRSIIEKFCGFPSEILLHCWKFPERLFKGNIKMNLNFSCFYIKKREIESCLERNNSIMPESTKSEKHAKHFMIELIMHVNRDLRLEF
jgi:hypothetical protein